MIQALFLLCLPLIFSACTQAEKNWQLSGRTMGTSYHITVVSVPAELNKNALQELIDRELRAVNQEMSTYIEDSELMRFNRAPLGEALPVSAPLAEVVGLSLDIYRRSNGAFDITVGPLVNLWGFGPQAVPEKIPADKQIAELLKQLGSDALELSRAPDRLEKKRTVELDLSAIAKGHGVDRVATLVEEQGVANYLVEIGGELRTLGKNPTGKDWRIGIESPSPSGRMVQKSVIVSGKSVATSGDYRNYYERGGKRYAHTLDPRSGRPLEHKLVSVTVIAESCAEADGLATAMNVMGAEAALELAERENLAVFLLVKTDTGFEERYSSAFTPYFERSQKERSK